MTVKQTIVDALNRYKGDDLYRARAAFRNRTPAQMQEQYGQSGQTCAEIVAGYEKHETKVNDALDWIAANA